MSCFFATRKDGKIAATFELTYACNLKCKHCMNESDENRKEELPYEQVRSLIKEMEDVGVKSLYFTGGEPLVYPEIDDLLYQAHKSGMTVRLATNGLEVENHLDAIRKYVNFISISLDGIKKTHDDFRHCNGLYEKLILLLKTLNENNIKVVTSTVIWTGNIKQLEDIIVAAKENNVSQMNFAFLVPVGRSKNNLCLSKEEYNDAAKSMISLKKKYQTDNFIISIRRAEGINETGVPCYGGEKIIHISATGKVSPCSWCAKAEFNNEQFTMQWKPGNLSECYKCIKDFQAVVDIRKELFKFYDCPAMAYIYSNSYIAKDPLVNLIEGD
jgi:MoaA/NifB/PqqE/SkfB family radical SAM enzyme